MTVLPPIKLRETKEIDGETHMRCSKCRTWKPEDQFNANRHTRSGRQSFCKPCQKEAKAKSLEKHKDKLEARRAANRVRMAIQRSFTKTAPTYPKPAKTLQKPNARKRKAIRRVSSKRKDWLKQYEAKKKADGEFVTAWDLTPTGHVCVIRMFIKDLLHPHHPLGRVACRILFYRWVTPTLHDWIHKRAAWAREQGLILPEMSGRESGPDQPDPFGILPEYRAYVAEHGLH